MIPGLFPLELSLIFEDMRAIDMIAECLLHFNEQYSMVTG